MEEIRKYGFDYLEVNITRKCNMHCLHCAKGDAQNVTITPQIIDTMFSQCSHINGIDIVDGETLLELDMLQYLLDSIDKYNLDTETVGLITNGSILDKRLIDIIENFVAKKATRSVGIAVSDDQFHDKEQSAKAVKFYNDFAFNRQKISIQAYSNLRGENYVNSLQYSGRAKMLVDNNPDIFLNYAEGQPLRMHYDENAFRTHQVCIENNEVKCELTLNANGNISFGRCGEYDNDDRLAIGNITTHSLHEIFTNHNNSCPYLCDECANESTNETLFKVKRLNDPIEDEKRKLGLEIKNNVLKAIWRIRKLAHEIYPHIPMSEIIRQFNAWLTSQKMEHIVKRVYVSNDFGQPFFEEYRRQYPNAPIKDVNSVTYIFCVLILMDEWFKDYDKSLSVYPFLSKEQLLQDTQFKILAKLEQEYIENPEKVPPKFDPCRTIPGSAYND